MQITDIKCYVLKHPVHPAGLSLATGPEYGRLCADETHLFRRCIKVETDAGIVGHVGGGNGYHLAELTRRLLRPEFVGRNPLLTEAIWHRSWELHRLGRARDGPHGYRLLGHQVAGGQDCRCTSSWAATTPRCRPMPPPSPGTPWTSTSGISRSAWTRAFSPSSCTPRATPSGTPSCR